MVRFALDQKIGIAELQLLCKGKRNVDTREGSSEAYDCHPHGQSEGLTLPSPQRTGEDIKASTMG